VKINIHRIPPEGLTLEEEIAASDLELDTDIITFKEPIKARAQVSRITNSITVLLNLSYLTWVSCSRCLNDFCRDFDKDVQLNYITDKSEPTIDLDSDIRDEIILGYPIKPLCKPDCKGLCPKCGKNLNEGSCQC